MFYTFLPKLLNMSLTAGVAVIAVLVLRLALKGAPRIFSYILWSAVLFRLLCPAALPSPLSLYGMLDAPSDARGQVASVMEYVPEDIVHTEAPRVSLPLPVIGERISDAVNAALPQGQEQLRADPLEGPIFVGTLIWMFGVGAMAAYAALSYARLRRKLATASLLGGNLWLADGIPSPFVIGLVRPKIYLPSDLSAQEREYILLHEKHHLCRGDHVVKLIAFIALSIHWFNPLIWIAFVLAGKDMEMSCDEAVVSKLGGDIRADYAATLLRLATGRPILAGMPLAFGKGDPKGRIRNLARWKRPVRLAVGLGIAVCALAAICLMTNPPRKSTELMDADGSEIIPHTALQPDHTKEVADLLYPQITQDLLRHHESHSARNTRLHTVEHVLLDTKLQSVYDRRPKTVTFYMLVLHHGYNYYDSSLELKTGCYGPTALTYRLADNGGYVLEEYWEPRDGSYYPDDIRDKFPKAAAREALDGQKYVHRLEAACLDAAREIAQTQLSSQEQIAKALDEICASPAASSNPGDYIRAHRETYQQLLDMGIDHTLRYCYTYFLVGGQTDLRGHIMAQLIRDIAEITDAYAPPMGSPGVLTGQQWFDEVWTPHVYSLFDGYSAQDLEKHHPAAWMLLEMSNRE